MVIKLKAHLTGFKHPFLITAIKNTMVPDQPYYIRLYSSTMYRCAGPALKINDQVINRSMAAALIKIQTAFGAGYNF